jgi:hypothetical protein
MSTLVLGFSCESCFASSIPSIPTICTSANRRSMSMRLRMICSAWRASVAGKTIKFSC